MACWSTTLEEGEQGIALLMAALAGPVLAGHKKVTVCHKPDAAAEKTLTVAARALRAHLKHGDSEGACVPAELDPVDWDPDDPYLPIGGR